MSATITAIRHFSLDQAREYIRKTGGWKYDPNMSPERKAAWNRYSSLLQQSKKGSRVGGRKLRFRGRQRPSAMAPAPQVVAETEDKVTLDLIEPATASAIICESLPYNLGNAVASITRPTASNLDLGAAVDYIKREILRREANNLK